MDRRYNWVCAIVAGSGSMLYGYDAAIIASTFAQQGFTNHFKPSATVMGAIGSSYFGGVVLGLICTTILAHKLGRKRSIQLGGVIGLVGAIMQTAAQEIPVFFVGRVVAGFASGIMLTTVNVYQSEIAPPDERGAMVAFQLLILSSAGGIASWVGYACNFSSNPSFSWRFPIALQMVPAIGLIIGCFFIPFSPRWLILRDRHAEAQEVLKRLHDDHSDHHFWQKEYIQISAQLAHEAEERKGRSGWKLIGNRSELKRVLITIVALTCLQTNGAQTIQVYQSVLYTGLGFSVRETLMMAGIFQVILAVGCMLGLLLIDRVGRRWLFLGSFVLLSICLAAFAACSARYEQTDNSSFGKGGVATVMIFIFIFGSISGTPYAYAAEILPTKIRALGFAIGLFFSNSVTIIFTQTAPIALDHIKWKFNFVFLGCNIAFFPVVFFFFPETKGMPLEAINRLFGDHVEVEISEIAGTAAEKDVACVQETSTIVVGSMTGAQAA